MVDSAKDILFDTYTHENANRCQTYEKGQIVEGTLISIKNDPLILKVGSYVAILRFRLVFWDRTDFNPEEHFYVGQKLTSNSQKRQSQEKNASCQYA